MLRRWRIFAIFLLLGAMINVAVAWSVRFMLPNDLRIARVNLSDPAQTTLLDVSSGFSNREYLLTMRPVTLNRNASWGDTYLMRTAMAADESHRVIDVAEFNQQLRANSPFRLEIFEDRMLVPVDRRIIAEYAAGWPLRSMRYIERLTADPATDRAATDRDLVFADTEIHGGIMLGWRLSASRHDIPLPLKPIFPGLLVNALIYGAILWLLTAAFFTTRGMLRRKRRLCIACAYPIGTSPVCTECGAGVRL